MGRTCFVPGCKSGYKSQRDDNKISLFRAPLNKIDEWQKVIPLIDKKINSHNFICEKHFLKDFIIREVQNELYSYPLSYPKLAKDAIPTIFPGFPEIVIEKKDEPEKVEYKFDLHYEDDDLLDEIKCESTEIKCESPEIECESPEMQCESPEIQCESPEIECESDFSNQVSLFEQLLMNDLVVALPSQKWAIQHIVDKNRDVVCISEMILTVNGNTATRKKIIISKYEMKVFLFEKLIDNNIIFTKELTTIGELENGICDFDTFPVCGGGSPLDSLPENFNNFSYKRDDNLKVLRHISCLLVLPRNEKAKVCSFCKKSKKAVNMWNYKQKIGRNKLSRVRKALQEAKNIRKREKRLKLRHNKLLEELKIARREIKKIRHQDIVTKLCLDSRQSAKTGSL